ncbi:phospho-N-acetylmuramoyl-pentapeptide-transferase [Candidatus Bipolaricaulota bacterium]|nr:phospho-N-acetylmuramoyl-pentapeptide-transferase [Candidatus Bipolaricaulota bacterium]
MGSTATIAGLISLSVSFVAARLLIILMNSRGVGQYIRSWGPKVHEHKSGTPTLGGLAMLAGLGSALIYLWLSFPGGRSNLILFVVGTFGFGAIGFLDDVLSLIRGKAKGLSPGEKIIAQIAVSLVFLALTFQLVDQPTQLSLPFSSTILSIDTIYYWPLVVFILVSTVNAVNLTDGMDGLAAGATIISVSAFGLIDGGMTVPFVAAILAAIIGFLWYNSYPATLFMGDTGAFALGGFLGSIAVLTRSEIFLPLLGGLFVLECLSVLIQVCYYKSTGSRVFKISPLHHHFESAEGIDYQYFLPEVEWSEPKVTARLLLIHMTLAGIGLAGFFIWD